jgi:hypothetical protein
MIFGVWPNWLWRTLRVREVLGSNPSTPTAMISVMTLFLLRLSKSGYNFLVFLTVRKYGSKNGKNSISDF